MRTASVTVPAATRSHPATATRSHLATAAQTSTCAGPPSQGTPTAVATDSVAAAVMPTGKTVAHRRSS